MVAHGLSTPGAWNVGHIPIGNGFKGRGAILYWSNRADIDEEEKRKACESEFAILIFEGKDVTLDVLRECEGVIRQEWNLLPGDEPIMNSIVDSYPDEVVAIYRDALNSPMNLIRYFRQWSSFDREGVIAFGIDVLKRYGTNPTVCCFVNLSPATNMASKRLQLYGQSRNACWEYREMLGLVSEPVSDDRIGALLLNVCWTTGIYLPIRQENPVFANVHKQITCTDGKSLRLHLRMTATARLRVLQFD